MRRFACLATALVTLAACGATDGDSGSRAPCKDAQDGTVTLVADDLRWDTDCLRAKAGSLTIEVDNRDDDQNHNIHLPDAPGSPATDLEQGPSTQALHVDDLAPGSYEFVCDIHPNMVGTLTVR